MKQIKSSYVLNIILSYVEEQRKLGLVKYNKKFQKILKINEMNYRLINGKYIIQEKNGNSKVYDYNDNLIFEGAYLNEKRTGKGKEYNIYGELLFEGEYLNGKKWNGIGYYVDTIFEEESYYADISKIYYEIKEGKGYMIDYDDEESIYEGEYLNGQRNGIGRDYKKVGNKLLIYDGEYLNGKRNGKGKEYLSSDVKSAICGKGTLFFEGDYLNGRKWNGKGYDDNNNVIYEIKNGNGYIKEYFGENLILEGEYLNGMINGKCKKYFSNKKTEFEGTYLNGKKYGKGKEYNNEGNLIFEGEYLYNYKIKGKEYYNDGKLKYEGEYLFNVKWNGKGYDKNGYIIYELINGSGKIKEYDDKGLLQLEGEYLKGKGNVKTYAQDGKIIFEGEYLNGKKHGKGKEFNYIYRYNLDNIVFEGVYLNGKRWTGKGKIYDSNLGLFIEGEFHKGKITGKGENFRVYNNFGKRIIKFWNGKGKTYIPVNLERDIEKCYRCNAVFSIILVQGKRVCTNCGIVYYDFLVFDGDYIKGKRHGKGKEFYFNGKLKFEGDYLDSLKWNGKEYDINGQAYEIKNGNGYLKEYDYAGELIYEGEYLRGRKWNGKFFYNNEIICTLRDGKGIIKEYKYKTNTDKLFFEGEYLNGLRNGKGKKYYINTSGKTVLEFEGEYLNGVKHGIGKKYCDGYLLYEGEYLNGKMKKIKSGDIKNNINSL